MSLFCCESNVTVTTCPLSVRSSLVSFESLQVHSGILHAATTLAQNPTWRPDGCQFGPIASGCALTRPGRSLLAPPNPELIGKTRRVAETLKQSFGPKLLYAQKPLDVLVRKPRLAKRIDVIDIECLFAVEAAPEVGCREGIQPLIEVSEAVTAHGGVRRLR